MANNEKENLVRKEKEIKKKEVDSSNKKEYESKPKKKKKSIKTYNVEITCIPDENTTQVKLCDLDVKVYVMQMNTVCKEVKNMAKIDNNNLRYIAIIQKYGIIAKIAIVRIAKGKIISNTKKCSTKSEIDKLELHPIILKKAKEIVK